MGFVGCALSDCCELLNITPEEFKQDFEKYYRKGLSFQRFEALQRLRELSGENANTLHFYMDYRERIDSKFTGDEISSTNRSPQTTLEVIQELHRLGKD